MAKTHLFINKIIMAGFISLVLLVSPYTYAEFPLKGAINKDGVNVRVDSTVFAKSIGVLKKGDNVKAVKEKFNWYKIILPRRFVCYASSAYLKKMGKNTARVEATALNLRVRPSLDSAIIGKVKKGTTLRLLKEQNGWAKVEGFPYIYGWVHKKFINLLPDKTKNNSLVLKKKENKKTIKIKSKKNNSNINKIDNYDYFAVKGIIYKLSDIDNCPANYKLKNEFTTFFLKIPGTEKADKFLKKKVTVIGRRRYEGCSYIYTKEILPSK